MKGIKEIAKAVIITAEVVGHEISTAAAEVIARELSSWPGEMVSEALRRCQSELTGRLTLAAIIQRMPDGHPGVEEAWSLCPRSEADTAVLTDQIAQAYKSVRGLLESGDEVAARMAFKETYLAALREAREGRQPASWWVSMGTDASGRVAPVRAAVAKGRLPAGEVARLGLGEGQPERKALPAPDRDRGPVLAADDFAAILKKLKGGP